MERIIKETKQHFIIDNPEKKKKKKNADIMQVDSDNTTYINNNFDKMKIESNRNASTTINFPNNTLENSNTTQIQNQPEAQDVKQFYIERENNILIHHYGPDLYNFSKELEEIDIKPTYLSEHKVDSHVRTKMIDWMIEVLYAYNCDTPTFYLAVHLLDLYISRSRVPLTVNDIHLSGICCIYIASKMEDIVPLRMTHVKTKIGHNKFTEKEIKKREKQILMEIDFEVISTSTYDFINTFILDFKLNNKQNIKDLDMNKHIDALSNVCIFLSKLVALNEEFTQYRYDL